MRRIQAFALSMDCETLDSDTWKRELMNKEFKLSQEHYMLENDDWTDMMLQTIGKEI